MKNWHEAMDQLNEMQLQLLICWLFGYSNVSEIEFIARCELLMRRFDEN